MFNSLLTKRNPCSAPHSYNHTNKYPNQPIKTGPYITRKLDVWSSILFIFTTSDV